MHFHLDPRDYQKHLGASNLSGSTALYFLRKMKATSLSQGFVKCLKYAAPSPSTQCRHFRTSTPRALDLPPIQAAAPIDTPDEQVGLSGQEVVARQLPKSSSYFTGLPNFTDDLIDLKVLYRKYETLPRLPTGEAERIAWKTCGLEISIFTASSILTGTGHPNTERQLERMCRRRNTINLLN